MARKEVNERSAAQLTANIVSSTGGAVSSTALDSLTLTLYNKRDSTGTIINSRNGQNVLNVNNVTVGSTGLMTWTLQAEDNIIVDSTTARARGEEHHVALFQWQWGGSTGQLGKKEFDIYVQNLDKVT